MHVNNNVALTSGFDPAVVAEWSETLVQIQVAISPQNLGSILPQDMDIQ